MQRSTRLGWFAFKHAIDGHQVVDVLLQCFSQLGAIAAQFGRRNRPPLVPQFLPAEQKFAQLGFGGHGSRRF